jgi:Flp pilus assembly protein CpaB
MKRANILFAASFIVGIVSFQLYGNRLKEEVQGGPMKKVLITTQDISSGQRLSAANLGVLDVPSDYIDSRRILLEEKENLLGVSVQTNLKAGDGLAWSDIADGAARRHLASLVTPGKRAYKLGASTNSFGSLLRVGDHVDVLLEERGATKILLERILILAVGEELSTSEPKLGISLVKGGGVTLSVDSSQAQELLAAESRGDLRLVLRSPEDFRKRVPVSKANEPQAKEIKRAPREAGREIEHVR